MIVLAIIIGILSAIFITLLLAFIGILYDNPEQYGYDESREITDKAKLYLKEKGKEFYATKNSQQDEPTEIIP